MSLLQPDGPRADTSRLLTPHRGINYYSLTEFKHPVKEFSHVESLAGTVRQKSSRKA